jgi:hypothetical protein
MTWPRFKRGCPAKLCWIQITTICNRCVAIHHQVLSPYPGPCFIHTCVGLFLLLSIKPRQLNHTYFEHGGHIGVPCLELWNTTEPKKYHMRHSYPKKDTRRRNLEKKYGSIMSDHDRTPNRTGFSCKLLWLPSMCAAVCHQVFLPLILPDITV